MIHPWHDVTPGEHLPREFNAIVWMPPNGARAGDVLLADSTVFSTLFGVSDSVRRFWLNIAK